MFARDPDNFVRKWKKFSSDGFDKLVVIADFDYTLTPFFKPTASKEQAPSSHGILLESDILDADAKRVARGNFEHYYPIEQSATLTVEEKLPCMIEWWTKDHELMIEQGFTKHAIEKTVRDSGITFRDRFTQVFDLLEAKSVPALIFSAGLYDVIHAVLDKEYKKEKKINSEWA